MSLKDVNDRLVARTLMGASTEALMTEMCRRTNGQTAVKFVLWCMDTFKDDIDDAIRAKAEEAKSA